MFPCFLDALPPQIYWGNYWCEAARNIFTLLPYLKSILLHLNDRFPSLFVEMFHQTKRVFNYFKWLFSLCFNTVYRHHRSFNCVLVSQTWLNNINKWDLNIRLWVGYLISFTKFKPNQYVDMWSIVPIMCKLRPEEPIISLIAACRALNL